ncbi:MAG: thiamine phosphate synthase [Pseudomonadota bacterium]
MSFPSHYLITPNAENSSAFLAAVERALQAGTCLLQLKGKGLDEQSYTALARAVIPLAHAHECRVLLSGDPQRVQTLGADGLHLDSKGLSAATHRPLPEEYLLAVSGHDLDALKQGEALGADFAVLSPVHYTKAHPDIEPLGWEGFAGIVSQLSLPVYALGGVSADDEPHAIAAGSQGIAGHKGYWPA